MLQDRMSETLSQSLSPEQDEAVHAELDAMEATALQEQMGALPEVPKVSGCCILLTIYLRATHMAAC